MLDIQRLRAARPQNRFHYFESTGSTMTEAARLLATHPEHGMVVIADQQTAGIGRLGRKWISQPDVGIYCSVLLKISLPSAQLPIASLLLGLAVAEAIQSATNLICDLRWPNDVLVNNKKVCGILTQLIDSYIVGGIGINVNQTEFEEGLRTPATSLRLETGSTQSREDVLIALLQHIDSCCQLLHTQGTNAIVRAFSAISSYVNGRRVTVEDDGGQGVTAGLDEHGFLLLRDSDGHLQRLSAGGVRAVAS